MTIPMPRISVKGFPRWIRGVANLLEDRVHLVGQAKEKARKLFETQSPQLRADPAGT